MAPSRIDPSSDGNRIAVLSVRLSRADYLKDRDLARREDRPVTTQCRHLIRTALHLSAPQATREDGP